MTRTNLTSVNINPDPFRHEYSQILSPSVKPVEGTSSEVVEQHLRDLGCYKTKPTSVAKLKVLLASFLMQAQRLEEKRKRKGERRIIGWPHSESYWGARSSIGYKLARELREALVHHGWIKHEVTAEINLYLGNGHCHGYLIDDLVLDKAKDLAFTSSHNFIYPTKCSKTPVKNEDAIDNRTRALWALWQTAPLTHGNVEMSVAQRSFSNKELNRGGRFYGNWTTMKKEERLACTIAGRPVAEVDVSGMYLTLLFAMSGKAAFNDKIEDPYKPDALKGVDRKEIKAIINSAIGGGNTNQKTPTDVIRDAGIGQTRLTELRKLILPAFECLGLLKKGVCDSESLAVHETEIMMRVVEHLQEPIYILHDCLIGQRDRALHIGRALQDKFEAYCLEQGWMPVKPAFSVEDIDANGKIEKVNYSSLIVR